jgi:hypothetical protein
MRIRVGYGGPRGYRHGRYFPGGRRNNGGLTEIERLIHLIASMQILFGSRRGGFLIPLLLIGLAAGGYFLYKMNYSPERALEKAHVMWDSNETKQQMAAIAEYKKLLQKSDPIEPGRHWLRDDRDTLYRRIILHEVKFAGNRIKAAEWAVQAWDEGLHDLRFQDDEVKAFWEKTIESLKVKNKNRNKNKNPKKGKFDLLPGIDSGSTAIPLSYV